MLLRVKKLIFALGAVAICGQVLAAPVLVKSEQDIYEYKLDNGLRVVLAPNAKENKVFMNTVYLTGSLNDPKGKGGLAHLLEHLAFKGTKNTKGEEFQRQLDQFTLSTNASTEYYSTRYTNIVRPDQNALAQVLRLESERMNQLVLKEQYVPSEINIVRREREIRMDQPFAVLVDQVWKSAYGNESLGRLPIGDLNELNSIKMNELEQYYQTYYAPNNAVIVMSGKFDIQPVLKMIEEKFSSIPAKKIPATPAIPILDSSKMKDRQFLIKKGSDLAKFHIYLNGKNDTIQPILSLVPYLYTMQPSGHLYQNMVQNHISTDVFSSTWLSRDSNLAFLGAVYAPSQDGDKVSQALTTQVEQGKPFNENELQRVKNLVNNAQKNLMTNAVEVGELLSEYVVKTNGNWQQFFNDQKAIQALNVKQVNQELQNFLIPSHRVTAQIEPTPEDMKKAQQQNEQNTSPLEQAAQLEEPLKKPSEYKAEIIDFTQTSVKRLNESEHKIQRGQFANGLKYALYPVPTRDDRIYATISLDFGNEKSLMNKGEIIDLASYLLLRGSEKYTLQDITDQSIALDGEANVTNSGNTINVQISARKENFQQYFDLIVNVIKSPEFSKQEFDLIKSQSLQMLDRPYTEPEVVSQLTLSRLTEQYAKGDLRYHFEPSFAKQQLQTVTQQQVKDFYQQYFAMNHAQIAVTGEFNPVQMKATLQKDFAQWNSQQAYAAIKPRYKQFKAQQQHVLAEQRQFGNYQAEMTLPVGVYDQDAAALIVFSHILGDSQLSSRLARELREKNALVYGFSSNLDLSDETDAGKLAIMANYSAGRSAQVSQSVHKVLNDLLKNGVTEQELEAAKADIMKQRATVLEDDRNIHRMLTTQLKQGKNMLTRAERDQAIVRLKVADIHRVIQKYIKPDQLVEVMADQFGQTPQVQPETLPAKTVQTKTVN